MTSVRSTSTFYENEIIDPAADNRCIYLMVGFCGSGGRLSSGFAAATGLSRRGSSGSVGGWLAPGFGGLAGGAGGTDGCGGLAGGVGAALVGRMETPVLTA